jgi:hypothetical protein
MTNRLDTISTHVQELNGFWKALAEIDSIVSLELIDSKPESQPAPAKRVSTSLKSLHSPPLKARPVEKVQLPAVVQDVLRNTGLSTNQESAEGTREALAAASMERDERLQGHRSAVASSICHSFAEAIGRADNEAQAVSTALFSNTVYKNINFTSKPLELRMSDLETTIRKIGDGIINVESEELFTDEAKVAEFIGKWSHE